MFYVLFTYNEPFRKKSTVFVKCRENPEGCHLEMKETGKCVKSKACSDIAQRTEKFWLIEKQSFTAILQNVANNSNNDLS